MSDLQAITGLRTRFYKASKGKQVLLNLILENEVSEQVYNSNAIENITLTLDETEKILLQIDLDRFISQREMFEATNLARVVKYIDNKAKNADLDIEIILLLHKMLISNINDQVAGRFRNNEEWVRVGNHIAPNPVLVETLVDDMLIEYYSNPHESIIKRIAILHLTFEHIHPFVDGNGRIGRVLTNYLLIREGYVPINIKFNDRKLYYDAFNEFNNGGKSRIMEEIVYKALKNSYHKRLAYLENKEIIPLTQYSKNTKQSHSSLLNRANRQTIEAFTEKGKWFIGV
jgi:Fic family protein